MERIDLPYDHLQPDPEQVRKHLGDLQVLADALRASGWVSELLVRPREGAGEGRYWIVAGERRWRAIGLLREEARAEGRPLPFETVPCLVTSRDEGRLLNVSENLGRKDLSLYELAVRCLSHRDDEGLTLREIGRLYGLSDTYVGNALKIIDHSSPKILAYLQKGGAVPQDLLVSWARGLTHRAQDERFSQWLGQKRRKESEQTTSRQRPRKPEEIRRAIAALELQANTQIGQKRARETEGALRALQWVLKDRDQL